MDLVFLFKCMMGLYDLDLSYYLVSADSSNVNKTSNILITSLKLDMQELMF